MHLIKPGKVDLAVVLECIDLAHSEGKTDWKSFERRLSAELLTTIIVASLPICTELLINTFLNRVDNINDYYQRCLIGKLNKQKVRGISRKIDFKQSLALYHVAEKKRKILTIQSGENFTFLFFHLIVRTNQQKYLSKVSLALFELDIEDQLNKQLIQMCVRKGAFVNDSYASVLVQLIEYAKDLLALKEQPVQKKARYMYVTDSSDSSSESSSDEN